jgi:hypothetical protein
MVELTIKSPKLDEDTGRVDWVTHVRLRVSGDEVELDGDERLIDFTVPVVSLRTGETILFEQAKEEWARNLPNAYRAGDYVVDVYRDDDPLPPDFLAGPELAREDLRVREGARPAAPTH